MSMKNKVNLFFNIFLDTSKFQEALRMETIIPAAPHGGQGKGNPAAHLPRNLAPHPGRPWILPETGTD